MFKIHTIVFIFCILSIKVAHGDIREQFSSTQVSRGKSSARNIVAVTEAIEAALYRETGKKTNLSELWVIKNIVEEEMVQQGKLGCEPLLVNQNLFEILRVIKSKGTCSAQSYPFSDEYTKAKFENNMCREGGIPLGGGDAIFQKDVSIERAKQINDIRKKEFEKIFLKSNDKIKCQAEANSYVDKISALSTKCFKNITKSEIGAFLNIDIPILVNFTNAAAKKSNFVVGQRGLNIIGYDAKKDEYIVSKPWRYFDSLQDRYVDRISSSVLFSENITRADQMRFNKEVCLVLGSKDLARACSQSQLTGLIGDLCTKTGRALPVREDSNAEKE